METSVREMESKRREEEEERLKEIERAGGKADIEV